MALRERLDGVLVGMRDPLASVPQHDCSAAIFPLGDDALETAVVEWVVLGSDREPVGRGVETWASRHRPAFQDPVELQPKVPMEPRRIMLLYDEAVAASLGFAGCPATLRLCGLVEIALGIVGSEAEPLGLRGPDHLKPRRASRGCRS